MKGATALARQEGFEGTVVIEGLDFDSAALGQARRLFAVAMSIVGDAGEAEDAVQETLLLAWRSWDRLRDESARQAWLTRICVNHCLRRRGRLSRLPWPFGDRETVHLAGRDEPPPHGVPEDPRRARLGEALGRLSARQRAVLALHYHHGYSLDEAAALIGCRPGTARSHLARGLATLREELDDVRA